MKKIFIEIVTFDAKFGRNVQGSVTTYQLSKSPS
jgi:hypothetical protein